MMLNRAFLYSVAILFFIPSIVTAQNSTDTTGNYAQYMSEIDSTSLGSNLSLEAVTEVFRTSKDLEEFEKRLNDQEEGVNNLDLNSDGETDYLRVVEHAKENTHIIVIQAVVGQDLFQDVASIDAVQEGDKVTLQIIGDEKIYGTEYYLEPEEQEEVNYYPAVKIIFVIGYSPYYSPYHWGYYPPYYRSWSPYSPYYYHRRCYHRHYYHQVHRYRYSTYIRNPHARNVYNPYRKSAPIGKTKSPINSRPSQPSTQPTQRPSQPNTRSYEKPSQEPSAKPAQKTNQNPSTRPANKSSQSPSTSPNTQPTQRPSQPNTQSYERPIQSPSAKPAKKSSQSPSTKPAQKPKTQPSQQRPTSQQTRPSQPSRSEQLSASTSRS